MWNDAYYIPENCVVIYHNMDVISYRSALYSTIKTKSAYLLS